ncbi:MAG: hypothetical protein M5U09_07440 [Gammaproteobacteria bacterium]|nr:hypothetical protein [Gammaproteobacteria bacterium]
MSRRPPELFSRDLKFLVAGDRPRPGRRAGSHSHWLATAMIAVLVGARLGGDPSASIDIDSNRQASAASIGPVFGTATEVAADSGGSGADIAMRDPLDTAPPRSLPDDVFEWADDEYALPGLEFGPHSGTGQIAAIPGSSMPTGEPMTAPCPQPRKLSPKRRRLRRHCRPTSNLRPASRTSRATSSCSASTPGWTSRP